MARLTALLLALMLLLVSAGCLRAVPTDEYSYVIDLGVEKGEVLPYRFFFMINNPSGGSGESASKENVSVISAEARDLYEAVDTLAGSSPNQLNFARTTLLLFSRELAEAGAIADIIDVTYGKLKIRESCRVMIAADDIQAVFEGMVSSADPSMTKIKVHMAKYAEAVGVVPDVTLGQMLEAFASKTHDIALAYCGVNTGVPIPDMAGGDSYPYLGGSLLTKGLLKTSIGGCAVFRGERMVGVLDGQHTMLLQMARDEFTSGRVVIPFRGTELTFTLYKNAVPRVAVEGDTAVVHVGLEAALERPIRLPDADREELETAIAEYLSGRAEQVFAAVQGVGSDVFGFGCTAVKRYTDMGAWRLCDWDGAYRELSCSFVFTVKLSHDPKNLALE